MSSLHRTIVSHMSPEYKPSPRRRIVYKESARPPKKRRSLIQQAQMAARRVRSAPPVVLTAPVKRVHPMAIRSDVPVVAPPRPQPAPTPSPQVKPSRGNLFARVKNFVRRGQNRGE